MGCDSEGCERSAAERDLPGTASLRSGSGASRRRLRAATRSRRASGASRLDRLLITGALFCLFGIAILLYVVVIWAGNDFGPLAMTREMLTGTTLVIVGVQTILSGFLLSVIAGNDAELDVVVRRENAAKRDAPAPLFDAAGVRGSSDAASR